MPTMSIPSIENHLRRYCDDEIAIIHVHYCARFYNSCTAKGKRFDHISMLLMEMRLFLESLCFDRALFLLRTLSLVIWLAEIEARGGEM